MVSGRSYLVNAEINRYVYDVSVQEHPVLVKCREETQSLPNAVMQISPEQGQLFRVLLAMLGAKETLEVGVFTGYSSTVTALALPPDGKIVACDVSDEYTSRAKRYWKEAGIAHKIDLRVGPAAETLQRLNQEGGQSSFDFAFIDADKSNYDTYYELTLPLIRPEGLIVFDNMLRRANVLDAHSTDPDVRALRALNEKLGSDSRVLISLLAIADGVTLAWKKP
jgi:predicted O-methyltransferase YrrM